MTFFWSLQLHGSHSVLTTLSGRFFIGERGLAEHHDVLCETARDDWHVTHPFVAELRSLRVTWHNFRLVEDRFSRLLGQRFEVDVGLPLAGGVLADDLVAHFCGVIQPHRDVRFLFVVDMLDLLQWRLFRFIVVEQVKRFLVMSRYWRIHGEDCREGYLLLITSRANAL